MRVRFALQTEAEAQMRRFSLLLPSHFTGHSPRGSLVRLSQWLAASRRPLRVELWWQRAGRRRPFASCPTNIGSVPVGFVRQTHGQD